MKKVIYYLLILGLVFTGCNPMEDIYNEIDGQSIEGKDYVKSTIEYLLTEDDYALYETELDYEEYFISQDQADVIIPNFLTTAYPVLGEGSLVNVTYNLYSPTTLETMTATETLSNLGEIDDYLAANYETAPNGSFVELTYDATVLAYDLSSSDFEAIEDALGSKYPAQTANAASYGNFGRWDSSSSYWSDDMILEAMDALLVGKYAAGQVVSVSFATYGPSSSESFTLQYNGSTFLNLDIEVTAATGTEYTLTDTDYDDIVAGLAASYPNLSENLASYGSIDVRTTSDNYWSEEVILEGLNLILPTATEGDIYVVTYIVYNGSTTTQVLTLKYESGAYVVNPPTITEVTTTVAKNNGDWEFPYVVSSADYDLLGEPYGNFGSSSIYKLDIFLASLKPYAAAGETITVSYRYYDGETTTKYGTSVFDGDKWNLTLDVVETTFQYGFESGVWIPDNTIGYTLLSADYEYIAIALADNPDFSGLLETLTNYHDYDYNWSNEQIVESLAVFAAHIAPSAEEGQKYLFTYLKYDSGLQTLETKMIFTDGVWIEKVAE